MTTHADAEFQQKHRSTPPQPPLKQDPAGQHDLTNAGRSRAKYDHHVPRPTLKFAGPRTALASRGRTDNPFTDKGKGSFRKWIWPSSHRTPRPSPSRHPSSSLLHALTAEIVQVFLRCNPNYSYDGRAQNPRRVLTKPSKPIKNDGYDNEDNDYILYVNDLIGNQEGRRYRVMDMMGQGTFGQVAKCQNCKTGELVGIKIIKNKTAYFNQSMMEVTILEMLNERLGQYNDDENREEETEMRSDRIGGLQSGGNVQRVASNPGTKMLKMRQGAICAEHSKGSFRKPTSAPSGSFDPFSNVLTRRGTRRRKRSSDIDDPGRHIIKMLDTFIFRNHLCIVFELLSMNLYEIIKQNHFRGLSTNLVRVFATQILDALILLNEARIIHCDLKPENILLKDLRETLIKVIDFGSACPEQQTLYSYIQSRFYRSPEVLLGLPYSSSIDIWSLGCIVAELFLGLPLFPGTSEYNQLCRIVEVLGLPPAYMIDVGKSAAAFFERSPDGKYQLKSMDRYMKENKVVEQESKRYFQGTTLSEIIMNYPMSDKKQGTPEYDKEIENRSCLADFVSGLLKINPIERWSPRQAMLHPFITLQPFRGPFQPPVPQPVSLSSMHTPVMIPEDEPRFIRPRANTLSATSMNTVPQQLQKLVAAVASTTSQDERDKKMAAAVAAAMSASASPVTATGHLYPPLRQGSEFGEPFGMEEYMPPGFAFDRRKSQMLAANRFAEDGRGFFESLESLTPGMETPKSSSTAALLQLKRIAGSSSASNDHHHTPSVSAAFAMSSTSSKSSPRSSYGGYNTPSGFGGPGSAGSIHPSGSPYKKKQNTSHHNLQLETAGKAGDPSQFIPLISPKDKMMMFPTSPRSSLRGQELWGPELHGANAKAIAQSPNLAARMHSDEVAILSPHHGVGKGATPPVHQGHSPASGTLASHLKEKGRSQSISLGPCQIPVSMFMPKYSEEFETYSGTTDKQRYRSWRSRDGARRHNFASPEMSPLPMPTVSALSAAMGDAKLAGSPRRSPDVTYPLGMEPQVSLESWNSGLRQPAGFQGTRSMSVGSNLPSSNVGVMNPILPPNQTHWFGSHQSRGGHTGPGQEYQDLVNSVGSAEHASSWSPLNSSFTGFGSLSFGQLCAGQDVSDYATERLLPLQSSYGEQKLNGCAKRPSERNNLNDLGFRRAPRRMSAPNLATLGEALSAATDLGTPYRSKGGHNFVGKAVAYQSTSCLHTSSTSTNNAATDPGRSRPHPKPEIDKNTLRHILLANSGTSAQPIRAESSVGPDETDPTLYLTLPSVARTQGDPSRPGLSGTTGDVPVFPSPHADDHLFGSVQSNSVTQADWTPLSHHGLGYAGESHCSGYHSLPRNHITGAHTSKQSGGPTTIASRTDVRASPLGCVHGNSTTTYSGSLSRRASTQTQYGLRLNSNASTVSPLSASPSNTPSPGPVALGPPVDLSCSPPSLTSLRLNSSSRLHTAGYAQGTRQYEPLSPSNLSKAITPNSEMSRGVDSTRRARLGSNMRSHSLPSVAGGKSSTKAPQRRKRLAQKEKASDTDLIGGILKSSSDRTGSQTPRDRADPCSRSLSGHPGSASSRRT